MGLNDAQRQEFVRSFRSYMADRQRWRELLSVIKSFEFSELDDCLQLFVDELAGNYDQKDDRLGKVFHELASRALDKGDQYFAVRFEAFVNADTTKWRSRWRALDSGDRGKLERQIARGKAPLSWAQKTFLDKFGDYMQRPSHQSEAALEGWVDKLKFLQVRECLLVYVEASQRFTDDDKNSLKVFYGLSLRALGGHDIAAARFAAQYDAYVHAAKTVWKRRYDALDPALRKLNIDPAIHEAEKIEEKKTAQIGGKDVTAVEKHKIAPASAEGAQRAEPLQRGAPEAREPEYEKLLRAFLSRKDEKQPKEALDHYLQSLDRKPEQLRRCVLVYLRVSEEPQYAPVQKWSLYAFFGVTSVAIERSEAYYAFKYQRDKDSTGTVFAKRYAALDQRQRASLDEDIDKKIKHPRLIDELKFAYFQANYRDPDVRSLREFDVPLISSQLQALAEVKNQVDRCGYAFVAKDMDSFRNAFAALSTSLEAWKDPLLFAMLVKRYRDDRSMRADVRRHLYWYLTGALCVLLLGDRPEVYYSKGKKGLSDEESAYFFTDDDRQDRYYNDFAFRLDYIWLRRMGRAEWARLCGDYLVLLLFGERFGTPLVPLDEAAEVYGLAELVKKSKPEIFNGITVYVNSRWGPVNRKLNDSIGSSIFIVWADPIRGGDAYVQLGFEHLQQLLFRASSERLGRAYDADKFYLEIYRSTEGALIGAQLLFEALGYLPDLLTGGISGVIKAVIINTVIEKTADALGLNTTALQLMFLGAGVIAHGLGGRPHVAEDTGTMNKGIGDSGVSDPAPAGKLGAGEPPVDVDMRGVPTGEGHLIRGDEHVPVEAETGTASRNIDHSTVTSDGVANRGTSSNSIPEITSRPATRNDLNLAQQELDQAQKRVEIARQADRRIQEAKDRLVPQIEDNIEKAEADLKAAAGTADEPKVKKRLENLKKTLGDQDTQLQRASAEYQSARYAEQEAKVKVARLTRELAARGELVAPRLKDITKWKLPDKPTTFRMGNAEAPSWLHDAYLGTSENRVLVERLAGEKPGGELTKRILDSNGKLYPAAGAGKDMAFWKAHPESIELAHVLSRSEGGRDVYILMTKYRNQLAGQLFEHPGSSRFIDKAIVIDGFVIERQSALDMGIAESVVANAPVIDFAEFAPQPVLVGR